MVSCLAFNSDVKTVVFVYPLKSAFKTLLVNDKNVPAVIESCYVFKLAVFV